jgi:hypothetical protein
MAYIDYNYYTNTYKGTPIAEEQFGSLAERASDVIDMVTSYLLHGVEFTQFAQLIQDNVKKATAAQVEYMFINGGETAVHGGSPSSVNIGNFSYSEGAGGEKVVSPAVICYLKPTGLLYKGVSVYGY